MVCKPSADGAAQVRSPTHTYTHLVREPFTSGLWTIQHICVYKALEAEVRPFIRLLLYYILIRVLLLQSVVSVFISFYDYFWVYWLFSEWKIILKTYGGVNRQENTHDGSICYQKWRTSTKITTEVWNTYICRETKFQEVSCGVRMRAGRGHKDGPKDPCPYVGQRRRRRRRGQRILRGA